MHVRNELPGGRGELRDAEIAEEDGACGGCNDSEQAEDEEEGDGDGFAAAKLDGAKNEHWDDHDWRW